MTEIYDEKKNWTGRAAARNYIIWLILWTLIDLVIITWVFARTPGKEEAASSEFPAAGSTVSGEQLGCCNVREKMAAGRGFEPLTSEFSEASGFTPPF